MAYTALWKASCNDLGTTPSKTTMTASPPDKLLSDLCKVSPEKLAAAAKRLDVAKRIEKQIKQLNITADKKIVHVHAMIIADELIYVYMRHKSFKYII